MYTYVVKDRSGNWFQSKYYFITKHEAEAEAAEIAEYEFVDQVEVLDEDDEELRKLHKRTKIN